MVRGLATSVYAFRALRWLTFFGASPGYVSHSSVRFDSVLWFRVQGNLGFRV